jgi:hypothetical protein
VSCTNSTTDTTTRTITVTTASFVPIDTTAAFPDGGADARTSADGGGNDGLEARFGGREAVIGFHLRAYRFSAILGDGWIGDALKALGRKTQLVLFACAALAVGGFFGARLVANARAKPTASPELAGAHVVELRVPHLQGNVALDGDLDDVAWQGAVARTGAFVAPNGADARPYSDARVLWGDGHLYLALYAADEDVRAQKRDPDAPVYLDDSFHFEFTGGGVTRSFDVNALGVVTDAIRTGNDAYDYSWKSGLHVSTELDGTINDPTDHDEEWLLEIAIPLEALGLEGKKGERVGFAIKRCDTPKGGARSCGTWAGPDQRGVIVLD